MTAPTILTGRLFVLFIRRKTTSEKVADHEKGKSGAATQDISRLVFQDVRQQTSAGKLKRVGKAIGENIGAHPQCFKPFFLRIIMDSLIFPAIPKIAFVRIEYHQATLIDET